MGAANPARLAGTINPGPTARTRLMLEGAILPTLLKLSAPNLLYFFAMLGLIVFDGLFVRQLGLDALAGVALVFPFVMAVLHLSGSGIGGAVTSSVARAIGAGDRKKASALAAHAIILAVCVTSIVMMIMLPLGTVIYTRMGARGHALDAALLYSSIVFGGVIFICLFNILASVVRGTGNMLLPALVQICLVAGYMVISPLLIFGAGPMPTLGVAGGGFGLLGAFGLGSLYLLRYMRSGKAPIDLHLAKTPFEWRYFSEFLRVGIPGIFNVAANNLAVVGITMLAGQLERDAQIGYALAARLEYIIIPIAFVFGMTLVAMVGTNWGARQYGRARHIAWTGGALAGVGCGLVGGFCAIFPELWMGLFTSQKEIVRIGGMYLLIVGPAYALFGFGQALYFARQGFGNPLPAVLANLVRFAICVGGGFFAIRVFGNEPVPLFALIAFGFAVYALLNALILWRTRNPVPGAV